ncbi:hypothetical protein MHBO_001916 [Bonamia ostreae]|uniref:Uncharacterized protein n=1 Tax=Bonamia ostreae TaxID=126728 RepID=A0ABV2AKQ9_9EUKA
MATNMEHKVSINKNKSNIKNVKLLNKGSREAKNAHRTQATNRENFKKEIKDLLSKRLNRKILEKAQKKSLKRKYPFEEEVDLNKRFIVSVNNSGSFNRSDIKILEKQMLKELYLEFFDKFENFSIPMKTKEEYVWLRMNNKPFHVEGQYRYKWRVSNEYNIPELILEKFLVSISEWI